MKKNKMLYVITLGDFGGAQKFCHDFCVEFNDSFDITVLCGNEGWLTEQLKKKE